MLKKFARRIANALVPGLIYRRFLRIMGAKERELLLIPALCVPGKVAVDVGANRGLYVHHLLRVTKRVIAFEPLPNMAGILRDHYKNAIQLHEVALSSSAGSMQLRFPDGVPSWATLEPSNSFKDVDQKNIVVRTVPVRTLDDFGLQDVGFIKIDVEGHEEEVVAGGLKTIAACRPNLVIEIEERHKAGSVARVQERIRTLGYAGFFIDEGSLRSTDEFRLDRDQRVENVTLEGKTGRYLNNFVFIPDERAGAFKAAAARLLDRREAA